MAQPNPEDELKRLETVLAQGVPKVVQLLGKARWFRERALDAFLRRAGKDVEVLWFTGENDDGARLLRDLRTRSLFGGCKVMVLRPLDKALKGIEEGVVETLPKIPAGHHLVLDLESLDQRTRMAKALVKAGATFQFRDLYDRPYRMGDDPTGAELVRWLLDRGRKRGILLTPKASLFLTQTIGTDPSELDAEIGRLLATGDGGTGAPLTPETLLERVHLGANSDQFRLAEQLLGGDLRGAVRTLEAFQREGLTAAAGRTADSGALFPIVGAWLRRTFRSALAARRSIDAGMEPAQAATQAGVMLFQDRFLSGLRRWSRRALETALIELSDAEQRSRNTGEEPVVLLERFVIKLLGPGGVAHERSAP
jgi:DNA polymerase III delta subunit